MRPRCYHHRESASTGFTLLELIVAIAIIAILTGAVIPVALMRVRRQKEHELRRYLWEMRDAIDHYKDAADRNAFRVKVGTNGYPPDLQALVDGVDVQGKKVRFLRVIPIDPMTGKPDWGMRSMEDDPKSDSFGGQELFDVHSVSQATSIDGSKYSEW